MIVGTDEVGQDPPFLCSTHCAFPPPARLREGKDAAPPPARRRQRPGHLRRLLRRWAPGRAARCGAVRARDCALPWSRRPLLLLLLGFAIFDCVTGDGNETAEQETKRLSCGYPNGNCTGGTTGLRWRGHFSKCPEEYKHYCIKGRCRYVAAEQIPACVCEKGYTGARCERLDLFYLRGDEGQIVVMSLIGVMVTLIVLTACICTCAHYCKKRRRKRREEEMMTFEKRLPIKTDDILETDIA
uniref:probetacellulin n=1 Tax=Podarcis muralis TaxID=64176 RepID=UPI0010A09BE1|nr:probetacellulin [Podarcis muralis]